MGGIRILILLLLPLLFLDGAHLKKDKTQAGQPSTPSQNDANNKSSPTSPTPPRNKDPAGKSPGAPPSGTPKNPKEKNKPEPKKSKPNRWKPFQPKNNKGNTLPGYMCPQPYGNFRYLNRCDEYIQCQNYIPVALSCPNGLQFNPSKQWMENPCDQASTVRCVDLPRTNSLPMCNIPSLYAAPASSKYENSFSCPEPQGYYKYNDKCDSYVACKNNIPRVYSCPPGLNFKYNAQWTDYPCDYPSRAPCTSYRNTFPRESESLPFYNSPSLYAAPAISEYENSFSCPEPQGYYKYKDECDSYVACKNNISRVYSCPPGLNFNHNAQWSDYPCDNPSTIPCTSYRNLLPKESVQYQPMYNDFMCPRSQGYFQDSGQQCGEYVECKNYIPRFYSCPPEYNFNSNADWTDYPCEHQSRLPCY